MAENITELLKEYGNGDRKSEARLYELVMIELKRIAGGYMRRETSDHTLQPTALVNEAYMKLVGQNRVDWQNRAHFYGMAANIMRRILVDHARAKFAEKRGGGATILCLDDRDGGADEGLSQPDLLALEDAMNELAALSERQARVVELKFYGGLNVEKLRPMLGMKPKPWPNWNTTVLYRFFLSRFYPSKSFG